uniref:Uncharacterized protein n=1 Tax=Peronospora matthiolae TaxID=2874970 RepID=A0AAV1V9V4_9STRA
MQADSVVVIMPHPTAESVKATYSRRGVLILYDVHASTMSLERAVGQGASLTSADWTWDGPAVIAATQGQAVRMVDPREKMTSKCQRHIQVHDPWVWIGMDGRSILSRVEAIR